MADAREPLVSIAKNSYSKAAGLDTLISPSRERMFQPWSVLSRNGDELITRYPLRESIYAPRVSHVDFCRLAPGTSGKSKLEPVAWHEVPASARRLVCLPGMPWRGTEAQGMAALMRLAESYLGDRRVSIYSYPCHDLLRKEDLSEAHQPFLDALAEQLTLYPDNFLTDAAIKFSEAVFVPLLTRAASRGLDEVRERFRTLTFVTHCQGGIFLQAAVNAFHMRAPVLGLSEEQAALLLSEVRALSLACNIPKLARVHLLPTVFVQAQNDPLSQPLLQSVAWDDSPNLQVREIDRFRTIAAADLRTSVTLRLRGSERTITDTYAHDLSLYHTNRVVEAAPLALAARDWLRKMVER